MWTAPLPGVHAGTGSCSPLDTHWHEWNVVRRARGKVRCRRRFASRPLPDINYVWGLPARWRGAPLLPCQASVTLPRPPSACPIQLLAVHALCSASWWSAGPEMLSTAKLWQLTGDPSTCCLHLGVMQKLRRCFFIHSGEKQLLVVISLQSGLAVSKQAWQ